METSKREKRRLHLLRRVWKIRIVCLRCCHSCVCQEEASERAGNSHCEHNIEIDATGKDYRAEARQVDKRAPTRDCLPVVGICCGGRGFDWSGITYRSANRIHKRCRQQPAQCRTKPRGEFIHAKCAVARNHYPVEQGWLLEPWHSTECWRDPIAPRKHLARHFRVARLVGTNERQRPKSPKIESADEDEE